MKLRELSAALGSVGVEEAEAEARLLFQKLGGFSTADLWLNDPDLPIFALDDAINRRKSGEPLAYILGEAYFYRESYAVTPDVLIPRSDTEILVDYAVKNLPQNAVFADLCTGSGCIAISVLANRPDTRAIAVDLSEKALAVAEKNAERNGVSSRITFLRQNVLFPFSIPKCDAILSNPPYIESKIVPQLSKEVAHEPKMALDGGSDGLDFYRTMLTYLPSRLPPHGLLLFEIGYDQKEAIEALADAVGLCCKVQNDYGGNPRLAILRKA